MWPFTLPSFLSSLLSGFCIFLHCQGSKPRLDAYIATQLPEVSRAKISASIKAGLVVINGRPVSKPSQAVKAGDVLQVSLLPPEPCTVSPLKQHTLAWS